MAGRIITTVLLISALIPGVARADALAADRHAAPGLQAPVRVIVDRWGIAHIRAASVHDAFFAQGWNAARDRLWQIDLWRKRGLGLLAASFGAEYVAQDRAARLLLYRGDMAAEWAAYPAEAHDQTRAFVAGINAYIDDALAGRAPLPAEFALTGTRPDHWQADDVVRIRSHALVGNLAEEVQHARLACAGGLRFIDLLHKIEPAHEVTVPAGLDPCSVPGDVLDTYLLGTKGVQFAAPALADAGLPAILAETGRRARDQEGSNNWVVDAAHSASGRPMLANDPHRAHGVPSLRYVIDLAAPGFHIAGAGEPALPGISFGHNDQVAWGLTIFYADQEDLYVYQTSPDHPGAYLYQGRWEPFQVVHEMVGVRGGADRPVELLFTRHGPVIHQDGAHAFGLRTVWTRPGGAGYFNASWLYRATGWDQFAVAHDHWSAPPLNLVYADVHGDIGWRPSAFMPQRHGWDGLLPVPGDGRYEWDGMIPPADLPMIRNPARGFVATANAMNLPPDWRSDTRPIGFRWVDPSRYDEIAARLAAKPVLGMDDMSAIQTDTRSPLALHAVALLRDLATDNADARSAQALLTTWDGDEAADSGPAALAEVWLASHLSPTVAQAVARGELARLLDHASTAAVVDWLARGDARLGPDPVALRRQVLVASLAAAWRETVARLGADPAKWRWGDLHVAAWAPAILPRVPVADRARWQVGPAGVGGSGSTPMATWDAHEAYGVTGGASVRMVLDVGAWDNSRVINTPGQSGDPADPHFRDLFALWAAGRQVPFVYSDAAVMAAAERVITLTPAP